MAMPGYALWRYASKFRSMEWRARLSCACAAARRRARAAAQLEAEAHLQLRACSEMLLWTRASTRTVVRTKIVRNSGSGSNCRVQKTADATIGPAAAAGAVLGAATALISSRSSNVVCGQGVAWKEEWNEWREELLADGKLVARPTPKALDLPWHLIYGPLWGEGKIEGFEVSIERRRRGRALGHNYCLSVSNPFAERKKMCYRFFGPLVQSSTATASCWSTSADRYVATNSIFTVVLLPHCWTSSLGFSSVLCIAKPG